MGEQQRPFQHDVENLPRVGGHVAQLGELLEHRKVGRFLFQPARGLTELASDRLEGLDDGMQFIGGVGAASAASGAAVSRRGTCPSIPISPRCAETGF